MNLKFYPPLFALLLLLQFSAMAVVSGVSPAKLLPDAGSSFVYHGLSIDSPEDFLQLTPKMIKRQTQHKLGLKDRIVLKIAQRKIKKQLKKGLEVDLEETLHSSDRRFNLGGFLLGLFFSLIGVLIAILFGRNAVRSALLGFLIGLILGLTVIIAV